MAARLILLRAGQAAPLVEAINRLASAQHDIAVSWDGPQAPAVPGAAFVHACEGRRWPALAMALRAHADEVRAYTHVWLPDAGVRGSAEAATQLFEHCEALDLDLAQAAFEPGAGGVDPLVWRHAGFRWRRTNSVDAAAPLFGRELLARVLPALAGDDAASAPGRRWAALARPERVAIIDLVTMEHAVPAPLEQVTDDGALNLGGMTAQGGWRPVDAGAAAFGDWLAALANACRGWPVEGFFVRRYLARHLGTADTSAAPLRELALLRNELQDLRQRHASLLAAHEPQAALRLDAPAPGTTKPEPLRTLHHFACTGGTLISKCIAALPNVQLLSEVDPLSPYVPAGAEDFSPTDMVLLLKRSTRGASQAQIADWFSRQLRVLHDDCTRQGLRLVLRDHAHSQFCHGSSLEERPSLRELMPAGVPLLSLLTVRHPLDSFASLQRNDWLSFEPPTIDAYCRRYLCFLDRHADVPVLRYEDFVAAPQAMMQRICAILDLRYEAGFADLFHSIKLSGDSGRSGDRIRPRPSTPQALALLPPARKSAAYAALLERLGYEAVPAWHAGIAA